MASVVGDKWQCRPLFILKQAFSMDFANEGSVTDQNDMNNLYRTPYIDASFGKVN
jgi:hypothetical protein